MRRSCLVFALLIGLIGSRAAPAWACSCAPSEAPLDELGRATAVFSGQVVEIDIPNKGPTISSMDPVKARVKVATVWKGAVPETVVVHTVRDGTSCGYEFQEGGHYLVYASGPAGGLTTGLCTRTRLLDAAAEDMAALGPGGTPVPSLLAGPTLAPRPVLPLLMGASLAGLALLAAGLAAYYRRQRRR